MIKNGLEDIGKNYFQPNYISKYTKLKDIQYFKQFFCDYLQKVEYVSDDNLDESFLRWCDQLSHGRAPLEVRRIAMFSLWIHCNLKQVHIAQLLGVSTRTIRRDMRALHKEIGKSGHYY
ncbi:MAG: DeoR family transcriptional regulator [Candidatus Nitrosopumilus sp. bin_6a]